MEDIIDEEGRLIMPLREIRKRSKKYYTDPAHVIADTLFNNKTDKTHPNSKVRRLFNECIEAKRKKNLWIKNNVNTTIEE